MSKNRVREGKRNKSFKKKGDKDNYDLLEDRQPRSRKPKTKREYTQHNPLMSKEKRNELMRQFSLKPK